jgi:chitin disaccharide deacetylase
MSGIRLVTRADDAGMHAVANHAIRETVTQGIVRNISLMAPTPAIRNAWEVLGDLGDRVDFGLHVTLTAEWYTLRWRPLTASERTKSFTRDDGTMHYTVPDLDAGSPDAGAMMDEVVAQYELLANLGFPVRYVDAHMGVDSVAGLDERIAEFCSSKGLVNNRALFATGAVSRLPDWNGPAEHPGTELADHLAQTEPGTYLVVGHPATKDAALHDIRHEGLEPGDVAQQRNRQRRMFMDIEIVDYCENVGIELLKYTDL